jgi:hypothetical protein
LKIFEPAPPANSITSPPPCVSAPGVPRLMPTSWRKLSSVVSMVVWSSRTAPRAGAIHFLLPSSALTSLPAVALGRPPLPNTSVVYGLPSAAFVGLPSA